MNRQEKEALGFGDGEGGGCESGACDGYGEGYGYGSGQCDDDGYGSGNG